MTEIREPRRMFGRKPVESECRHRAAFCHKHGHMLARCKHSEVPLTERPKISWSCRESCPEFEGTRELPIVEPDYERLALEAASKADEMMRRYYAIRAHYEQLGYASNLLDVTMSNDSDAESAAARNRWHLSRAATYGAMALIQQNRRIIALLEELGRR